MSIAEKETPLEMAERQSWAVSQGLVSLAHIIYTHPEADLSSIRGDLEKTKVLVDAMLKWWK